MQTMIGCATGRAFYSRINLAPGAYGQRADLNCSLKDASRVAFSVERRRFAAFGST